MKKPTIEQHIKAWLLIIVLGGGFLGYLRFIDGDTLRPVIDTSRTSFEYQTTQHTYNAGDSVAITSRAFCKLRSVPGETNYTLEDHVLLPFLKTETNTPTGCYEAGKLLKLVELPNFIGTDHYRIRGETCYQANPIRKICYPFVTNEFEVIKKTN
jgi:hypothetical protein